MPCGILALSELNSYEMIRFCASPGVQIYFLHVVLSQNGKSVIKQMLTSLFTLP